MHRHAHAVKLQHVPTALQVLAARLRPAALPAHEVLYKTAEEIAAKREEMRRAAEEAKLKVRGLAVAHDSGMAASRLSACVCPCSSCYPCPQTRQFAGDSCASWSLPQECLFRPVMVAQPKAKEGRAIKLAQELIQVGRGAQVAAVRQLQTERLWRKVPIASD